MPLALINNYMRENFEPRPTGDPERPIIDDDDIHERIEDEVRKADEEELDEEDTEDVEEPTVHL